VPDTYIHLAVEGHQARCQTPTHLAVEEGRHLQGARHLQAGKACKVPSKVPDTYNDTCKVPGKVPDTYIHQPWKRVDTSKVPDTYNDTCKVPGKVPDTYTPSRGRGSTPARCQTPTQPGKVPDT
jgi:hypothetical protein